MKTRVHPCVLGALLALTSLLLAACSTIPPRTQSRSAFTHDEITWSGRDGFGLDTAAVARYRMLGRKHLLDAQLVDHVDGRLAPQIATLSHGYEAVHTPLPQLLDRLHDTQQQIKTMPSGPNQRAARKTLQRHDNQLMQQARQAELLHAIYGPNQRKEQLVWFWLNHFSVYAPKGRIRCELADYEQHVIRPHALGKFRDLVMATLERPAMLEFLDNAQDAKGHLNENHARELMELHTLGVGSGYTQQDVQPLALILTGVGLAPIGCKPRHFNAKTAPLVVRQGLSEFNPHRHDFHDKTFLCQRIERHGFDEVKQAVDLVVHQPACAQFVSRQLSTRFNIAAAADNGNTQLFTPMGSKTRKAGFPMLSSRLYFEAIEPWLSAPTRAALAKAQLQQEWNTFLLSSPELNYR